MDKLNKVIINNNIINGRVPINLKCLSMLLLTILNNYVDKIVGNF